MNVAFLLMSSAALTGADVAPAAPAAPVVISSGAGCSNCGAPAVAAPCGDCGKTKIGLFDKLKARLGGLGKKSHDCGCAPVAAPAPCHSCGHGHAVAARPNLFETLKSRMGHKKCHTCGPVCDPCGAAHLVQAAPCATPGAPVVTAPMTTTPPKEMPKPKETPKEAPKTGTKEAPKTGTKDGAGLPAAPVTGASGLTGAGSPY